MIGWESESSIILLVGETKGSGNESGLIDILVSRSDEERGGGDIGSGMEVGDTQSWVGNGDGDGAGDALDGPASGVVPVEASPIANVAFFNLSSSVNFGDDLCSLSICAPTLSGLVGRCEANDFLRFDKADSAS